MIPSQGVGGHCPRRPATACRSPCAHAALFLRVAVTALLRGSPPPTHSQPARGSCAGHGPASDLPITYQRREAPFRPEGEAGTVVRAGVARPGLPCRTGQRGPAAERPLSPLGLQVPEFSRCVGAAGGSRAQLCVLGGFRGGAGGLACAPGASALQPHAEEAPSRHHRHTWWRCRPQLVLPRFLHLSIEGLTITGARKRLLGKVNSVATEGDVFCSKDTCQTSS